MRNQVSNYVGYYVQNLAKLFIHRHNTMLEQIGLTYSQFRVIFCLWERDGRTQNCILKDTLIKPSSLTGLLLTLERKGYLERRRTTEDGRSKVVWLTDKGKQLEQASFDIIVALEEQVVACIPEGERAHFLEVLKDFNACCNQLDIPELPASAKALVVTKGK